MTVPDVHPWAPGDGYLYDLEVQLVDPAGALVDSYHQSVGVRTVEVRGTEFLINGEPFRFTGFGMHEDHPTLGKGHNDAFLVQDFALLDVDRGQLVPDVALPLLRGRPRPRRPARHRGDRRDRGGRPEHGSRRRHLRRAGLPDLQRRHDQRRDAGGARPGDPRARRAGQEPPERRAVVDRQRARVGDRGGRGLLPAAVRRGPRGRPDPAGGLRQRDARAARHVPGVAVRRRADAQPLLRLVHPHRRPRQRRGGAGGGAARLGGRGQADHHHRVRRRHPARAARRGRRSRGPRSTRSSTWR